MEWRPLQAKERSTFPTTVARPCGCIREVLKQDAAIAFFFGALAPAQERRTSIQAFVETPPLQRLISVSPEEVSRVF
jgi:hypothetical protein